MAGLAEGQQKVKCDVSEEKKEDRSEMICISLLSSLKRWMQEPCSQSQTNEGVHSWPPGCYAEIHLIFFRFLIVQTVPALVYLHVLSLLIKPSWGEEGAGVAVVRDCMLHLEAWLCQEVDWEKHLERPQQTDHHWTPMSCVFAFQQPSITDGTASALTATLKTSQP